MRPLLPFFFLLATSTFAAPVLGPEVPIATGPWVPHQLGARIATDGDTAFAIWTDSRACYPTCATLFGTPLDRQGRPLAEAGILLDDQFTSSPSIIWNGRSYVAIARKLDSYRIASFLIDRDGKLLREPAVIADDIREARLFASGSEVLLAGRDARGEIIAFLDADARPGPRFYLSDKIRSPDTYYGVTWIHDGTDWIGVGSRVTCGARCTFTATRIRMRGQGLAIEEKPLFTGLFLNEFSLVRGGDRILIGWAGEDAGFATMALDGTLLTAPVLLDHTASDWLDGPVYNSATAAWDGRQFALVWSHFSRRNALNSFTNLMRHVRITADGKLLQGQILHPGLSASLVSAGSRHFVSYFGFQVIDDLNALEQLQPGAPRASSAPTQGNVILSRGDRATLALFAEESRPLMRVIPDDGSFTPVVVAPLDLVDYPLATIVWNGDGWTIAWRTVTYQQLVPVKYRVLLRRLDRHGTALDASPIVLFEETMHHDARNAPGLAYDGTNYFVAWTTTAEQVVGARVSPSGVVLDATPFPVSNAQSGQRHEVRTWWTGSEYFVVWHDDPNLYEVPSNNPSTKMPHRFRTTRITRDGRIAELSFPILASQPGDPGNVGYYGRGRMDAASNGREVLLTWSLTTYGTEGDCAFAQRFSLDATPIDSEARRVVCGTSRSNAPGVTRALWDGSRWWVFASSIGREQKTVLMPLDDPSAAIVLTGKGDLSDQGDAVVTPGGFLVGYNRLTPEAGWVRRLYLRAILAAPRTRAVRR